jgi:eukaryotic-like serine/threonine-protein kinase
MSSPFVKPPEPGDILAGKYRIERVLGQGGMGFVLAAHHLQLDERVALKFLLPEMTFNDEAVKRFVREARAAVKIKSEHVARVSDVATLDNGVCYLVMEYLEGADLASELERRGPFAAEEAVELVLQACEAIAEAHTLGIVHRDLKPANLFLTRRANGAPWVKVLDFGISKISRGPDVGMTSTSAVMGSPLYMSPEQIRAAREVDARADLWALGVILYELLCGRLPFKGDTLPQLSVNIAIEPAEPFPPMLGVPVKLQATIFRCLEKDRELRFSSIAELAYALLPFANRRAAPSVERITAGRAFGGTAPPSSSFVSSATQAANAMPPSREPHRVSRSTDSAFGGTGVGRPEKADGAGTRRWIWAVGLVLTALVLVGTLLVMRSHSSTPTAAAGIAPATSPASSLVLAPPVEPPRATPPSTSTLSAPTVPAPNKALSVEPSVAPSASAVAVTSTRPAPSRDRRSAAARANAPKPAEPERPSPSLAAAPEPRPAPPPASTPAPVDVFNNRKF